MSNLAEHNVVDKETGSANDLSERENIAIGDEKPQRQRGRVATCCRRFWWLILIILVIVVLVVVLPVVYVAFPKTIQDKIDDTDVTIQGIRILQPKVDSVWCEMNATISGGGGVLKASIDGFNASLYLEDKPGHVPFAYLNMPPTKSGDHIGVNISQKLDLWNPDAYRDYNTWYLLNETFRVTIDGHTNVHVKGLKKHSVHFHKTVTLTGLNGFKGLAVTSSSVSLAADSQGDNFHGFVNVPNPAILTVEIGNATFINRLNDTAIGHLYIDNMILYPGNNNLSIRANISQTPILAAVTSEPYCKNGTLPLGVQGQSVIHSGVHLPYYEAGFQQNKQTVEVDVGADLSKTLGSPVGCSK